LEDIQKEFKKKEKELLYFEDELYSIPSNQNPYTKYGYKLNPFSLWVPLEKPTNMIDQNYPQEIAQEFITMSDLTIKNKWSTNPTKC
jgi:hypothetical protein